MSALCQKQTFAYSITLSADCYNRDLWVLPSEKPPQYTSKRNPRATSNLNRESLFKDIVLGRLSNVLIASLAFAFSDRALAMDVWIFHGACKDSTFKQGSSPVDNQDSAISCDAGYIMELGNGRKLLQFGLKQSELVPPGFSGGAFKYVDGHYALVLDTVYPQRVIAGKTTEQIYSETMKTTMPTEGYCFFNDANFSNLTQISCIAKVESEDTNISYNLTFEISDITVKRYNEGSHNK
jgi:hypothetical protein